MAVYKRRKIWYIDYYVDGKRYREAVGLNRKVAERALAKRMTLIAEKRFFNVVPMQKVTYDQLAENYIKYANANKLSAERDRRSVAILKRWFGGHKLCRITPLAIERYKSDRRKEVGPATVNRELACLKHMFTKAIQWELASDNPVKKVRLFRENPGRIRYLDVNEIARLFYEAADHLKPILIVALFTGMRKSEILNLVWDDLNFKNQLIYVRNSKNGEAREIPMANEVFSVLNSLPVRHERVFTHVDGTPINNIRTCFCNAVKRAAIPDFTFHDLRHTFASYLIMSGVELVTVKELLGHKTINMTLRYAHLSPSHKRAAVNMLNYKYSHKSVTRGKNPVAYKYVSRYPTSIAGVVELVDTRDLKSLASSRCVPVRVRPSAKFLGLFFINK